MSWCSPPQEVGGTNIWVMGEPVKLGIERGAVPYRGGITEKQLSGRLHYFL